MSFQSPSDIYDQRKQKENIFEFPCNNLRDHSGQKYTKSTNNTVAYITVYATLLGKEGEV